MEITLANSVEVIAIISFAAAVIKYTVVNPLQGAINTLGEAVGEIKQMLSRMDQAQQGIDKRLVAVEESAKSAHKRIDGLEGHQ